MTTYYFKCLSSEFTQLYKIDHNDNTFYWSKQHNHWVETQTTGIRAYPRITYEQALLIEPLATI